MNNHQKNLRQGLNQPEPPSLWPLGPNFPLKFPCMFIAFFNVCHGKGKVGSTVLGNGKLLKIFVFKKITLLAMEKKWNGEEKTDTKTLLEG